MRLTHLMPTRTAGSLAETNTHIMRQFYNVFILLFLLWSFWPAGALSQEQAETCLPAWRTTGASELPISDVFAVERGPDGYIYFGSTVAMHRAEGSSMRSWYPDPSKSTALTAGRVRALASWKDGIFVGTASGLSWYDPRTDHFSQIDLQLEEDQSGSVFSILVLDDSLFVGHRSGLTILDASTHKVVTQIDTIGEGRSAGVYDLEPFRNGVVAITRDAHVFVGPDLKTRQLEALALTEATDAHYTGAVAPDNALWLSTGRGLVRIPASAETPDIHPDIIQKLSGRGTIRHIDFDPEGRLWIASDYDYARWDVAQPGSEPVLCRRAAIEDTDRPLPTRLLSWELGNHLVLGSSGRGPLIAAAQNPVDRVVLDQRYFPGIAESAVWSANEDHDGRMVLATIDGIFRETRRGSNAYSAVDASTLADTQVFATRTSEDGRLWAATLKGLFVIDGEAAEVVPLVRNTDNQVEYGAVISITLKGNSLLAATDNGLLEINTTNGQVVRYFSNDVGYSAFNGAPVTPLEDSRTIHVEVFGEDVFIVGAQAIHRVNLKTGTVDAAARAERDFSAGRMYASAITPKGDVFIGTSNGLVKTDRDLASFDYVTEINDAPLGQVSAVEIGVDGSLWHNSYHGVWRHALNEDKIELFSKDDGLHTNSPNQGGITILDDGRVIIANPKGLSTFDPTAIGSYNIPQAKLTTYAYGGDQFDHKGEAIVLPAQKRNLAVRFGTNSLRAREDLKFEYRLDTGGAVQNTRTINPNDEVDFAVLQPGEYVLSVRSTTLGRGASDWATTKILVQPYWWETRAARLGFVFAIIAVGIGFLGWRARRIARRHQLVGDERTRIAQDFHDTFLQEVLGALMLGRSALSEASKEELKSQVGTINSLLESAVDSARASVQDLADSSREIALGKALEAHDASALYGATVPVTFVEHGKPWDLRPQRAFFLARIAKEAINNACKHADASRIDVALNWKPFSVEVVIIDDGKGFHLEHEKSSNGFGLSAMKRLADSGRAKLEILSQIDAGTRVHVSARRYLF